MICGCVSCCSASATVWSAAVAALSIPATLPRPRSREGA